MNKRFTNALARVAQKTPPVWMMRQAGRYHNHYQNLRAKHSFVELCKKPELAAEVAMGPIRDFDFDVAILFSDLLFPLEAMGFGLTYEPAPTLSFKLDASNISKLKTADAAFEALRFQGEAMRATRAVLPKDKSLIGFVGSPWTLFAYAVESAHKGSLEESKQKLALFHEFSEKLIPLLVMNIKNQLEGGAEVVMIFDTAAGELSPDVFKSVVVPELAKLGAALKGKPIAYYTKGTQGAHYEHDLFMEPGQPFLGLGYDHRWDMADVLKNSDSQGFYQGNFDQAFLTVEPAEFERQFRSWIKPILELPLEQRLGWVCGLGHGCTPHAKEGNVRRFVQLVRELSGG